MSINKARFLTHSSLTLNNLHKLLTLYHKAIKTNDVTTVSYINDYFKEVDLWYNNTILLSFIVLKTEKKKGEEYYGYLIPIRLKSTVRDKLRIGLEKALYHEPLIRYSEREEYVKPEDVVYTTGVENYMIVGVYLCRNEKGLYICDCKYIPVDAAPITHELTTDRFSKDIRQLVFDVVSSNNLSRLLSTAELFSCSLFYMDVLLHDTLLPLLNTQTVQTLDNFVEN